MSWSRGCTSKILNNYKVQMWKWMLLDYAQIIVQNAIKNIFY